MSQHLEIFSIRIVIADFYLEKPIRGLDPCYSEFRGKEIKKVPIVRIFGSNVKGQKSCMHVHGVFPYFYIPYESKDFESLNKAIYQMAFNIDKAINISLGQTQSTTQHVFKIQLVKGLPFYGYHRREHQFLKVYMYNPRFVRRAANLLQNGSIMGKVFQPHESHVPYVLQFMIDYNLYGMSFLHVPLDIVKFRRDREEDVINYQSAVLKEAQIMSSMLAKKQSCSSLEVDIGSNFILNRFQLLARNSNASSNHSNPGIEAIWNDEDVRRRKLISNLGDDEEKINAIPPLQIPETQERPNVEPTESDTFYRTGLVGKLLTFENSGNLSMSDQTLNSTELHNDANIVLNSAKMSNKEMRRTFNLKKILANSVYPEECSPDEQLLDASCIENHLSGKSFYKPNYLDSIPSTSNDIINKSSNLDENHAYLDDTIVDEEMILNISQKHHHHVPLNATLRDEDMKLLDALQELEEQNDLMENPVDLDSTLAPFSQPHENFEQKPELLDKETVAMASSHVQSSDNEYESENEGETNLQDFSIALDDIDRLLLKLSDTQTQQYTVAEKPSFDLTESKQLNKSDSNDIENLSNALDDDDIDDLLLKVTQSTQPTETSRCKLPDDNEEQLPQIDGADDPLPKTPEKFRKMQAEFKNITPPRSPRTPKQQTVRSPRTPKSNLASRYTPLPLIITNRSVKRNLEENVKSTDSACERSNMNQPSSPTPLGKRLAMIKMRRMTISSAKELHEEMETVNERKRTNSTTRRSRKNSLDLDKTHVTCALTPPRRSERLLKFISVDASPKDTDSMERKKKSESRKTSKQPHHAKKQKSVQKRNYHQDLGNSELKNPFGLKKLKVRIQRKNLAKIAQDFYNSKSKELESTTKSSASEETSNIVNEIEETTIQLNPLKIVECESGKNTNVDENLGTHSPILPLKDNPIRRNLSQLLKVFQPASSEMTPIESIQSKPPESTETELKKKSLNTKPIFGIPKQSPLSLSRRRSKKNEISSTIKSTVNHTVSNAEDNIRRNLSELMKAFENLDEEDKNDKNADKNTNSNPNETETFDSSILSLRLSESSNDDEVIVASDTECDSKRKRTPKLQHPIYCGTPLATKPSIQSNCETPSVQKNFMDIAKTTDSPSLFSECSSPAHSPPQDPMQASITSENMNLIPAENLSDVIMILEPALPPPTREDALKYCEEHQIYEYEFQMPFYSNRNDITKPKDVGPTSLYIPGNDVQDLPVFQSALSNESGLGGGGGALSEWRRQKLFEIGGIEMVQQFRNLDRAKEYFATNEIVIIEPELQPPTRHDAKVWLKARELLQKGSVPKDKLGIDQDSPIKIRRQKITMMLTADETGSGNAAGDDDLDSTSCSLTLTPLTPPAREVDEHREKKKTIDTTPLTTTTTTAETLLKKDSTSRKPAKWRPRSSRRRSVRMSLNEKLKAAADREMQNDGKLKLNQFEILGGGGGGGGEVNCDSLSSSQQSNSSSHDSSSICSQVALAELERSSFFKQLHSADKNDALNVSFGLNGVTLDNTFGFKVNLENLQEAKSDVECNYLTNIVMELFVQTRDDLYPNPEFDGIRCIFYAIDNNAPNEEVPPKCAETKKSLDRRNNACGYILVNDYDDIIEEGNIHGLDTDIEVKIVKSEIDAVQAFLQLCAIWDADIYSGYEIEMSSWGYLIERAKFIGMDIAHHLSRVPSQKVRNFANANDDDDQLTDLDFEMKLCGRILLDVWRLMRSEIALTSYTFENIMYHVLHKRCPLHSYRDLTLWFKSPGSRWIVLEYYLERVRGILDLLDQLDLLGRTSEMAKLIGIQFYEVLSRGSQFRVESMMLRIAKPRNLVPLSPSVQQRAHMRAPEYLPLILEPHSRFYADPMIVLDFQSLYPSMIIGYNYCFSTCLGRIEHLGQSSPFEFGASQLRVSPAMLRKLLDENLINISPCGVAFVKSSVRVGILPRMLTEILETRLMVKQSMKLHKTNSALQRILHSRQLGLKLMANVTYGYTAANFSGRMPAVEVGDSVVAKGRETLERTIKMVEANKKWGAKVVYGDTDSLFVLVPGRNREQAFKIGGEIAEAATKENPHPVKLKLEKVYQPCILQTKKRYVGYMYESPDQTDPVYEAKGIETVRRDGCPAVAKMLEKVLRILFETSDVSQVKQYVCRQFTKLLSGRANLQDLIFAKEFRGLNGYKPTACVPALELTRKWIQMDPRRIPRRGERVPFIITNGPPGVPLIRLVRSPYEVLSDGGLKINAIYYITKAIIPPLNRCLLLIGADVNEWFANLPRKILMTPALSNANQMVSSSSSTKNQQKKSTISQYFSTTNCVIDCGNHTNEGICNDCKFDSTKCVVILNSKIAKMERSFYLTQHICQACCGRIGDLNCKSLDCPVLYVLAVKHRDLKQIDYFRSLLEKY